jgi:hypothetical protein
MRCDMCNKNRKCSEVDLPPVFVRWSGHGTMDIYETPKRLMCKKCQREHEGLVLKYGDQWEQLPEPRTLKFWKR